MFQYIFFHKHAFAEFIEFLNKRDLLVDMRSDDETFEIQVLEDLDDELSDEIEEEYDRLFVINQQLMDNEAVSKDEYSMAEIEVKLSDGTISQAHIRSEVMSKFMQSITFQEFEEVVNAIVDAVENPDSRSFCQQIRDGDVPL